MSKRLLLGFLLALIAPAAFAKTALDLMLEGRFSEAKAILDTSNVSPRYQLLYFAMVESDAARACSLYQVVAIRYPRTDCDTVARMRLDQAQDIGFILMPIAEWSQAPQEVRPLVLRRASSSHTEAEVRPQDVAATPVEAAPSLAPFVVPLPSVPVPEVSATPPVEKPIVEEEKPIAAVHDTIIPAKAEVKIAETAPVDTVVSVPPPIVQDVSASVTEPPVAVHNKITVPPAATSEPVLPVKIPEPSPPPTVSITMKPGLEPIIESKKPETSLPVSPAPVIAEKPEIVPAPPVAESKDRPASNGHWYVQVGAFANYDNAHRLALRLQNAGFPVKLVPRDTAKGKLLQVRVGGYATREELASLTERLKSEFQVPTIVISD